MAPQSKRAAEEATGDEVVKRLKEKIKDETEAAAAVATVVAEGKDTQADKSEHGTANNNHSNNNTTKNNNNNNNNNPTTPTQQPTAHSQKNGSAKEEQQTEPPATAKTTTDAEEADNNKPTVSSSGESNSITKDSESQASKAKSAAAEAAREEEESKEPEGEATEGVLLICGGANWEMTGRKELPKNAKKPVEPNPAARNLWGPHKVVLEGKSLRVRGVFSGCNACHSVIVTDEGETMTFGRNDKGQLGLGDTETRVTPTVVEALRGIDIVAAACGRTHTLFLSSDGLVFSCGDNKMGQCGTNQQAVQQITTPTRIAFKENKRVVKVACGAEFSMIVDADGRLYSFGHPEHGQLGHGSEGKYFTTGNKYAFHCEYQPRRIIAFVEKSREGHVTPVDGEVKIVDVACGTNHTLAVDTKHRCFAWGFAGYH